MQLQHQVHKISAAPVYRALFHALAVAYFVRAGADLPHIEQVLDAGIEAQAIVKKADAACRVEHRPLIGKALNDLVVVFKEIGRLAGGFVPNVCTSLPVPKINAEIVDPVGRPGKGRQTVNFLRVGVEKTGIDHFGAESYAVIPVEGNSGAGAGGFPLAQVDVTILYRCKFGQNNAVAHAVVKP